MMWIRIRLDLDSFRSVDPDSFGSVDPDSDPGI